MDGRACVLDTAPPPLVGSGVLDPLDTFMHFKGAAPCSTADTVVQQDSPTMPLYPPPQLLGSTAALASREDLHFEPGCVVRGDMATFDFDGLSIVGCGAILRPPLQTFINHNAAQCGPAVRIGAFTTIGVEVVSEAAEVGSFVRVDDGCVIGRGVIVPSGVWLQARTVVLPEAKLTPYTVYGGCPATACGSLDADAYQLVQVECVRRGLATQSQDVT